MAEEVGIGRRGKNAEVGDRTSEVGGGANAEREREADVGCRRSEVGMLRDSDERKKNLNDRASETWSENPSGAGGETKS